MKKSTLALAFMIPILGLCQKGTTENSGATSGTFGTGASTKGKTGGLGGNTVDDRRPLGGNTVGVTAGNIGGGGSTVGNTSGRPLGEGSIANGEFLNPSRFYELRLADIVIMVLLIGNGALAMRRTKSETL